jgi:hypothetical protein
MAEHDEFSIIDQLFKPLAGLSRESRGLMDDVSVLPADATCDIVVNTDAIVAGVHFFEHDPLDLVARKLMRVNLSDIVAKGAKPYGYQLITAWPRGTTFAEKQDFARGLKIEQDRFGLDLFGGDTVSTFGPLHVSMTMFGKVPPGRALSRMGARPGDKVLVSGYIGQAYLGLKALEGQLMGVSNDDMNELMMSYPGIDGRVGWPDGGRRPYGARQWSDDPYRPEQGADVLDGARGDRIRNQPRRPCDGRRRLSDPVHSRRGRGQGSGHVGLLRNWRLHWCFGRYARRFRTVGRWSAGGYREQRLSPSALAGALSGILQSPWQFHWRPELQCVWLTPNVPSLVKEHIQ